jgi:hypothetical protein
MEKYFAIDVQAFRFLYFGEGQGVRYKLEIDGQQGEG